jgi:hypothetical protein
MQFLKFWCEAIWKSLSFGWLVFGIMSTALPVLFALIVRYWAPAEKINWIRWSADHQAELHVAIALIFIAIYLIYAPYRLYNREHTARIAAEQKNEAAQPPPIRLDVTDTDARKELEETKKKLQTAETTVRKLQSLADAETEYHDIAVLNMIGKPMPDGDIAFNTPISKALEGAYNIEGTEVTYRTDSLAEQKFRETIAVDARFPFSYVGLGVILRERNDSDWRAMLTKAKSIFEETTLIPGHHPNHDSFLKKVKEILASN